MTELCVVEKSVLCCNKVAKDQNPNFLFSSLLSQTYHLGPIVNLLKDSAERKVRKMKILDYIEI